MEGVVAGSIPGLAMLQNNLAQVDHTFVPLSPSCVIWYQKVNGRDVVNCP